MTTFCIAFCLIFLQILIYIKYQSVYSFIWIGPLPFPASECASPLNPKVGQHSLEGEGVGGPSSDDWKESLQICILFEPPLWKYTVKKG